MDNWILKGPKVLVNEPNTVNLTSPTQVKVKVSYFLLTDYDALLFSGAIATDYPRIIGRAAVGIVTEAGANCYGIKVGQRVYLNPSRACGVCLECKSGKPKNCTDVLSAGRDFDGFLRDFVVCEYTDVAVLPESVDDYHALCIETVAVAENIYDNLNLSAGQKVAVIGANFAGNIIAQVLQYHKIIPILIDNNAQSLEKAAQCGILYSFYGDNNLVNNIKNVTGGNFCEAVVYCTDSHLPVSLCSKIIGKNKKVILSVSSLNETTLSARTILENGLTVQGISVAYEYVDTAINMLTHSAVNIDLFEKRVLTEYNPAELLEKQASAALTSATNSMTILKMIL